MTCGGWRDLEGDVVVWRAWTAISNQQAQWLEAKYKLTAHNASCSLNDGDGEYETSDKINLCKHIAHIYIHKYMYVYRYT